MRSLARPEGVGAVAGAVLAVLVFLPWWHLDPGSLGGRSPESAPSGEVLGYLSTYSSGDRSVSAWDTTPRTAIVLIVAGLLAIGLGVAVYAQLGRYARRGLAAAVTLGGLIAAGLTALRVADPPLSSYSTGAWSYAALAAAVVVAGCGTWSMRRT